MKTVLAIAFILLNISSFAFITKKNKRVFELSIQTTVEHWGMGKSKTDLFLAYLSSNEYQNARFITADTAGQVTSLGNAGDQCIYYNIPLGRNERFGKRVQFFNQFEIETFDVSIDFDQIKDLKPYDKNSTFYQEFTCSNHPFIDIENQKLLSISDELWCESQHPVDYAKMCFMYVVENFEYANPLSGFKSLACTLQNQQGDCGNLSSVFITLLRMKGIPARHLMGFRPDGSLHVWADFYIQDYGWVPVDVTYQKAFPNKDYFGNINFMENGFIVQHGIAHEVNVLDKKKRIAGLQTYTYQVSYTKEHNAKVYINRKVHCAEK